MKVAILVSNGRLQLRGTLDGGKRFYLSLGLEDSKTNRKLAQMRASAIELDILSGNFDPTLNKYRPPKAVKEEKKTEPLTLPELWERYTRYRESQVERSTLEWDYDKIARRIAKMPTGKLTEARAIRDWLLKSYAIDTVKRTLRQLSACAKWGVKEGLIEVNPFEDMAGDFKSVKKKSGRGGRSKKPFTLEEKEAIVSAFRRYKPDYELFVRFLFATGCRPGEAIALKGKHVKRDRIVFEEAYSTHAKVRKDTKTHTVRTFPINDSLAGLLEAIGEKGAEDLIFPGPRRGVEIDLHNFLNRHWKPIVTALVKEGKIREYLPTYNTRHTFISLCLDAGIGVAQIAEWVGNSPEIILKNYAGAVRKVEVPSF